MRPLVLMVLLPLLMGGEVPPPDRFDRQGPQPGDWLPDLPMTRLDGRPTFLRQEIHGLTLLVTSSLTCPKKSRSRYESLQALAGRFKGQLWVNLLYVIEAHPIVDLCPYQGVVDVTAENHREGILFRQPTTIDERFALAQDFRQRLNIALPILVDSLDNRAWTALGAAPNLALVVGRNGQVLVRQGWYDGSALEGRLREILAQADREENERAREVLEQEQQKIQDLVEKAPLGDEPDHLFYRGDPRALELVKKFPALARYQATPPKQSARWLLQIAAENGHVVHVEALLKAGAKVDAQSADPSALHLAATNGHLAVVDLLLTSGATCDLRSPNGTTALQDAAFAGQGAVVERLRAHGAITDLFVAAATGRIDELRAGLTGDASRAYLTDGLERNLLMYASANGQMAIVDLLLNAGVDPKGNPHARSGTPVHVASERGQAAVIRALLAAGVDPEMEVYGLGTPLIRAAKNRHLEATTVLLQAGVKTAVFDQIGYAPLHYAASDGDVPLVEVLLRYGADPTQGTQAGYGGCFLIGGPAPLVAPLHLATRNRHLAVMRLLLEQPTGGAAVVDYQGQGALSRLIRSPEEQTPDPQRLAVFELLLAAGIDLQVEDRTGHTALDHAVAAKDQELVDLLQAHNAHPGSGVERQEPAAEDSSVEAVPINSLDLPRKVRVPKR